MAEWFVHRHRAQRRQIRDNFLIIHYSSTTDENQWQLLSSLVSILTLKANKLE